MSIVRRKLTNIHILSIAGFTSLISAWLIHTSLAHTLLAISPSTYATLLQREGVTLTMTGAYFLTLALFAYLVSHLRKHLFRQAK